MGFFDRIHPKSALIHIKENHELLRLAAVIPWPDQIEIAMNCRASKVKALVGPEPHYRELLGAVALMSVRSITYRQTEDQIKHYAPARYLCNLMDSSWSPDHITIFDFVQMLGPEGMEKLNTTFLKEAQGLGLLDATSMMSDTTAQEAMIPYPNEVGLMKRFTDLVSKTIAKAGNKVSQIKSKVKEISKTVKSLARASHLFAKTKEEKKKVGKKLYHTTVELHELLQNCLAQATNIKKKSVIELQRISDLMKILFPQILHFIKTGFVAPKKIIHLQMSELYSIVRGKAGKSVEFGIKWGVSRIDGFAQVFVMEALANASDKKFCIDSIQKHIDLFGSAPETFGFDRGGHSKMNIQKAKKLGVKNVGIAPTGQAEWSVTTKMSEKIKCERAQVEGVIGNLKSKKYGFNKPNVKSTAAMITSGHRACLGFNLCKALRLLNQLEVLPA
jgi:IS5 family transposase